jgi:hypothetical protein
MNQGSGIWHTIHVSSVDTDTPLKSTFFCHWVRRQIAFLPCQKCRKDAEKYLSASPPDTANNLFVWGWEFHNYVNEKLGKPRLTYEEAAKMYILGEIRKCKLCGLDQDTPKNSLIIED